MCYGIHKPSIDKAELVPAEAWIIGDLICSIPTAAQVPHCYDSEDLRDSLQSGYRDLLTYRGNAQSTSGVLKPSQRYLMKGLDFSAADSRELAD